MKKKIDILKEYAASGDWHNALKVAAKFPQLGNEKVAITRAWEAIARPDFMRQIGKDPDALISAGVAALKARYSL